MRQNEYFLRSCFNKNVLDISQLAAFLFGQADVQPSEENVRTAKRQSFYCSNRNLSDALHPFFHSNVSIKSPVLKCCDCSKSTKAGWAIDFPQERVLEKDDNYNKLFLITSSRNFRLFLGQFQTKRLARYFKLGEVFLSISMSTSSMSMFLHIFCWWHII